MIAKLHSQRAHSKFSASGAERWFNCSGSVKLSEGLPDKSSVWAKEGTEAHEVLEKIMLAVIAGDRKLRTLEDRAEMWRHGFEAASFITGLWKKLPDSEILVETRIYLEFIHPEMFGTFDGAVVDHFGTLHVFDYKYGQGHAVSPGSKKTPNLQMVFYGIGLAHKFHWNFKRVRLWIIQPRIKGYEGPMFLDLATEELRSYVDEFRAAVERVEKNPDAFVEGSWCHWCRAKSICPLKREAKLSQAKAIFSTLPKRVEAIEDVCDFY